MSVTLTIPESLGLSAEDALEVLRRHAVLSQTHTKEELLQSVIALGTKLRSPEFLFAQYEMELTALEVACVAHRKAMTKHRDLEVFAIAEGNRLRQERIAKGETAPRQAGRP